MAGATSKDSDGVGIARTCADEGKGRGVFGCALSVGEWLLCFEKILPRIPFAGLSRQNIHLAFRCLAVAIGSHFMLLHVQGLHKARNHFGLPRVFSEVFRQLTRVVIVGPTLGNLRRNQLNDDVQRLNSCEIIGEMGADTE